MKRSVFEQRVGGAQYEDWGDGRSRFCGQVTEWDPPWRDAWARSPGGSVTDP